ncbi:thioesterase II family protein [Streptomyces prunicolor]|uniref:thioesterase II family protein n=1 Tax=Streptomyces prunicolor TaxID=67348 RepID=UPI0037106037
MNPPVSTDLAGETLVRLGPREPHLRVRLRVVCFPPEGTTAHCYASWPGLFPAGTEVLAAQYAGRGHRIREEPTDDMERLTGPLAKEISALPDTSLLLFGHRLGALVAFETARLLHAYDVPDVRCLFVSGQPAPFAAHEPRAVPDHGAAPACPRQAGRAPLAAAQADQRLKDTYRYRTGPPLTHPVAAVISNRDPAVTARAADGWRACTTSSFTLRSMAGERPGLMPRERDLLAYLLTRAALRPSAPDTP